MNKDNGAQGISVAIDTSNSKEKVMSSAMSAGVKYAAVHGEGDFFEKCGTG